MKTIFPILISVFLFLAGFFVRQVYTDTIKLYQTKKGYSTLNILQGERGEVTYKEVANNEWTLVAKETALDNSVLAWKLKSKDRVFTLYHIPPSIYWKHDINQRVDKNMIQLLLSVDSTVQPERWQN